MKNKNVMNDSEGIKTNRRKKLLKLNEDSRNVVIPLREGNCEINLH